MSAWLLAQNGVYEGLGENENTNMQVVKKKTHDASEHLVEHGSEAPPINFVAVRQTLDDLRRKVLRSSTERARRITLADRRTGPPAAIPVLHPRRQIHDWRRRGIATTEGFASRAQWSGRGCDGRCPTGELLRESKVGKHDVAVPTDKDVLRLEITVDDAGGVQAFDTLDNLSSVESGSVTTQATPACELSSKIASWVEVLEDK
jgi:hypothetical protein